MLEVTPDKKLVWALREWTDPADLGPASSLQLLDEPGVAENGDLQPWRWPEPATGEQTQLPHA
ncbi:MAG: hypothetical protein ABSH35_33235 [Isosphaeraceae bacterium]